MASEATLPARLQWTLAWQTKKLMPLLRQPTADQPLRAYWQTSRRMSEVLERVGPGPASVSVDVGGGLTTPLRWCSGRRICVDPLAVHYADRFPLPPEVQYVLGQGEALPLETASADLVVCTNCIDHTDDPWALTREVQRVLRPGGWFWLTCEENPPDQPRNAGHPHALDRHAIRGFVAEFEVVHEWQEPWRGIYGHLLDRPPHPALEFGFLARKPGGHGAG